MFAFEQLAKDLPKKKFFPLIKAKLDELCVSSDPKDHEAMFYVWGAVAEGFSDNIRKILPSLMTDIFPYGISNNNSDVRFAAMKACCHFSEFVQPEILDYHDKVVPSLIGNLSATNKEEVIEHSIFSLDIFIENMEENDIEKHLPTLVPSFLNICRAGENEATYKMRYLAIDAIGSCIVSGKDKITPYFDTIYDVLMSAFQITDPNYSGLKASAILALGKLANFCCKDNLDLFKLKFSVILEHCINTPVENGDYSWVEGVNTFYYNCANILGEQFAEVFPKILEGIFEMASSNKGVTATKEEGEIDLESDAEDDELDSPIANMSLTFIHAKSSALRCLGEFAQSCPLSFSGYFKRLEDLVDETYAHVHENVRHQSILALQHLMIGKVKQQFGGKLPEKSAPGFANAWVLNQEVQEFLDTEFFVKYNFCISNEESKENAAIYLELFGDIVDLFGPVLLKDKMDQIEDLLSAVLNFEIKCFIKGDEDLDDEESDTKIFSDIMTILSNISKVLHNDCNDFMIKIFPSVENCVKKGDLFEHEELFGVMSDIFETSPLLIPSLRDQVTQLVFGSIELMDEAVSRNAAFMIGAMFE